MEIDGSCHCGRITYRAEIDPEAVYVCHCTDCQEISGSPFRWAVPVPEEKLELLSGTPKIYAKTGDGGQACPPYRGPAPAAIVTAPSAAMVISSSERRRG